MEGLLSSAALRRRAAKTSGSLCWQIIRNNHAYLVKKRDIKRPFSSESMNLKNVNSFRYNGFCRDRLLGIDPSSDGKGVVLSFKTRKYKNQPAKNTQSTTLKSGPRRTLFKIHRWIRFNRYRKDLRMAALRRASVILRSQKDKPFRKIRRNKKRVIKNDKTNKSQSKKPQQAKA